MVGNFIFISNPAKLNSQPILIDLQYIFYLPYLQDYVIYDTQPPPQKNRFLNFVSILWDSKVVLSTFVGNSCQRFSAVSVVQHTTGHGDIGGILKICPNSWIFPTSPYRLSMLWAVAKLVWFPFVKVASWTSN